MRQIITFYVRTIRNAVCKENVEFLNGKTGGMHIKGPLGFTVLMTHSRGTRSGVGSINDLRRAAVSCSVIGHLNTGFSRRTPLHIVS
jgi:hypothetical protein